MQWLILILQSLLLGLCFNEKFIASNGKCEEKCDCNTHIRQPPESMVDVGYKNTMAGFLQLVGWDSWEFHWNIMESWRLM